jgi:hypothetical protein
MVRQASETVGGLSIKKPQTGILKTGRSRRKIEAARSNRAIFLSSIFLSPSDLQLAADSAGSPKKDPQISQIFADCRWRTRF